MRIAIFTPNTMHIIPIIPTTPKQINIYPNFPFLRILIPINLFLLYSLEDALYLSNIADKVYLIHRRDELRGAKVLQDKVFAADNIKFVPDTVVTSINGSDGLVSSIDTKNVKTNMEENILVNGIFIAVGMKPNVSYINEMVQLDKVGYVMASEDGITSKKGIFVAGDVRTKVLRQVITAVSDGANAVASVEKYLREQN